ncbi:MAG TPA: hypothetical protein DCL35_07560 [Candidatus Omnitrophica bacterium]|nr:hypothetical protein [Candidatus Omnitrophota bacterium]
MVVDRDHVIDVLRGLAIFTMVAANMAASVLAPPHPFWFRLYGSFAAPLFIFISGMMIAIVAAKRAHGLKYYFARGVMVILCGVFVDVFIWRIYPFMSVDVLYLIGLSLPFAYLFMRFKGLSAWAAVVLVFLAAPLLRNTLGYTAYPLEIRFMEGPANIVENAAAVAKHWVIDGWFPVFPWIGFSLLGVIAADLRGRSGNSFGKAGILFFGLAVLALGVIIWRFFPAAHMVRKGYSELFYPADTGYSVAAIGLIIVLFSAVDLKASLLAFKPLQALGESALFMYIFHLLLIRYCISPTWHGQGIEAFWAIYVILSFVLVLIAYELKAVKVKWKNKPFVVQFLLGG